MEEDCDFFSVIYNIYPLTIVYQYWNSYFLSCSGANIGDPTKNGEMNTHKDSYMILSLSIFLNAFWG